MQELKGICDTGTQREIQMIASPVLIAQHSPTGIYCPFWGHEVDVHNGMYFTVHRYSITHFSELEIFI